MKKYVLQKVIGFDEWHLHSLHMRFYALPLIRRLNGLIEENNLINGKIIEVGCGLGDILCEIKWKNRIGYDLDSKAIIAAKILHPFMRFEVGSFSDIKGERISVIMALNFLHTLDDCSLDSNMKKLLINNEVDRVIVDQIEKAEDLSLEEYAYIHNYQEYFDHLEYELEYESKSYPASGMARRRILYFRKRTR